MSPKFSQPYKPFLLRILHGLTPGGGRVIISLTTRDRTALITVTDTGIGIAPAEQTRIFHRFYRADGDRTTKPSGTGLGLAIAKAIALAHHGKLEVQSEIDRGSKFIIRLPKYNNNTERANI